jgi:hypothetical protein
VSPDTRQPILTQDDQLRRADFRKAKHSELVLPDEQTNPAKARGAMSARCKRPVNLRCVKKT